MSNVFTITRLTKTVRRVSTRQMWFACWIMAVVMAVLLVRPSPAFAGGPLTHNSWTTVAPMPTARYGLAAALGADGRIYAIGGLGQNNVALTTVEAYTT